VEPKLAAVRDASIEFEMEECALGMGEIVIPNDAAVRDVRTKLEEEECA
jgi:hypothetical protein